MQTKPEWSHVITATDLIVLSGHKLPRFDGKSWSTETQPSTGGRSNNVQPHLKTATSSNIHSESQGVGEREWAVRVTID